MTHAWLFTGPPGSGRSVAARAFAAALECDVRRLRPVLALPDRAGRHPRRRPDGRPRGPVASRSSEMRAVVQLAARRPATGRWQIVLIEDADRLTEGASNALLKAVEEPPPHTVFLLCAPSTHPDDVSVTIRSRCRVLALRTPSPTSIAEVLVRRDGIDAGDRAVGGVGVRRPRRPGPPAGHRRAGRARQRRRMPGGPGRAARRSATCSPRRGDLLDRGEGRGQLDVRAPGRRRAGGAEDRPGRRRHRQGRGGRGPRHGRAWSRSWSAGRSRGPPAPSATCSTGRWSTCPASTATSSRCSSGRTAAADEPGRRGRDRGRGRPARRRSARCAARRGARLPGGDRA